MLAVLKGVRISYRLATPVALAKATVKGRGCGRWLGDLGNPAHQWNNGNPSAGRRRGDHTAWSEDGPAGVVKAFDWRPDNVARFRTWWLAQLRAGRYATAVKFSNLAGRQYGPRGGDNGASDDDHFHLSLKPSAVNKHVDVIADYLADMAGKPAPAPAASAQEDDMNTEQENQLSTALAYIEDVRAMLLDGKSPTGNQTTGGGVLRVELYKVLEGIKATQGAEAVRDAALKAILDKMLAATGGTGNVDTGAIVAAVRVEAEKTRAAVVEAARADLQAIGDAIAEAG